MHLNLFNDQVRKRKAILMQLDLHPLEVILADCDFSRSLRPTLAKPGCVLDIAEPEIPVQSGLVFALQASLGAAVVAATILAVFAWSGVGL
jgi:hypothetical protein